MEKSLLLTEQPVETSEYRPYDIESLPKLILGFNIKNRYDQERLKFKYKYQPKNILHFICKLDDCINDELEPMYIHGIELEKTDKIDHILELIDNAQPISLHGYRNILKYNDLSCETCYSFVADGLYTIDIEHLSKICEDFNKTKFSKLREMLEPTPEDLPWFSSWSAFKIFLLTPVDIY